MQEQQYTGANTMSNSYSYGVGNGTDNGGSAIVRFLLGLFTGAAIAAPVTALITKKICDSDKQKAVEQALIEGENRGIQATVEVAREEMANMAGSANRGVFEPNRGISEGNVKQSERFSVTQANTVDQSGAQQISMDQILREEDTRNEAYLASLQSPADDDGVDYDLENYDLNIDDEEATQEAREFSEQHAVYLDMVERYKDSGGIPPLVISREQFENEHFYEKSYINWYEDDDVFEEDDRRIEDPAYTFGFSSGRDMFSPERVAVRDEEDICHIRNMKMSTDFEVTRIHGSYEKMIIDGEVYYHGETNSQY